MADLRARIEPGTVEDFFRPQFFYRFGFSVERRYAGLVKVLEANGETVNVACAEQSSGKGEEMT